MLAVDTTDQHQSHVFSVNCKICSGKMSVQEQHQQEPVKDERKAKKEKTAKNNQEPKQDEISDKKQTIAADKSKGNKVKFDDVEAVVKTEIKKLEKSQTAKQDKRQTTL